VSHSACRTPECYRPSTAQRHLRNSENRVDSIRTNGRHAAAVRASAVEDGGSDSDRLHRLFRASGGMADALASGASVLRDVGVQVPLRPQKQFYKLRGIRSRTRKSSKEVVTFVPPLTSRIWSPGSDQRFSATWPIRAPSPEKGPNTRPSCTETVRPPAAQWVVGTTLVFGSIAPTTARAPAKAAWYHTGIITRHGNDSAA
jgi:hypothetical protein